MLLVLFTFMAILATIGIVAALSIWSGVSNIVQEHQGRRQQAFDTARTQLASYNVAADPNDFDVQFYDDGCIVSGAGYSRTRGAMRYDVSIAIEDTENRLRWIVDTVTLNGEVKYRRTD